MLDVQGADTKIWEESLEADIKMLEGDGGNTGRSFQFSGRSCQEVLEPCVAMIDVFEFLGAEDTIASGLSKAWGVCYIRSSNVDRHKRHAFVGNVWTCAFVWSRYARLTQVY